METGSLPRVHGKVLQSCYGVAMDASIFRRIPFGERAVKAASHLGGAIAHRLRLLRHRAPDGASHPPFGLLLGELVDFVEPITRFARPRFKVPKSRHPRVVILIPGFATHPLRMRYMARKLEGAGHKVKRWGLGYNFGPTEENFEYLSQRVRAVHERYGQQVVLVGWSLGGIFAREIAKRHPEVVAKVVTMGSPFSHTPYSNNVWPVYQLVTGHSVEDPPVKAEISRKPPVETVALWSPRDGVVSARSACGHPGERDRAVALRCTHMGFSNAPEAILAVAKELEAF